MCDKPRGPPGWWDSPPLTLCSAVPTKGRQQGILQLLASGLLWIVSPSEKIQHKGQKVVWVAEQVARLMQRHRSPKSHCTMNVRAEVGRSTGKCTVWFYLEWKLLLCPVGSSLLPQHARSGQFSFKGHGRSIFTLSYFSTGLLKLRWITFAFISLLQLYRNRSFPMEQWHQGFLHALWKVCAASSRRE